MAEEDRVAALLLDTLNREVPACMTASGVASMYGALATATLDLHLRITAVHGKVAADAALNLYFKMTRALVDEVQPQTGPLQ